jgi:hypothetical protein
MLGNGNWNNGRVNNGTLENRKSEIGILEFRIWKLETCQTAGWLEFWKLGFRY